MPKSDQSRWWWAAEAMLAAALVVFPWSLGGAPGWTLWVLWSFAVAATLFWSVGSARNHRRWQLHPALGLPVALMVLAALQLMPLPPSILSTLSAPAAELREFALVPLNLTAARPVSLDPPSTARALARLIGLGSLFFVALQLGRVEAVRRRLFQLQVFAGLSIALTGMGHLLAGVDSLFGLHRFTANLSLVTPFGNTNHLAAYLVLSATVALGLALGARSREGALGWAAAAMVLGLGVFLSFSRGGIVTFVATWLLVGAAALARRGGGLRAVLPWVVIGSTVVAAGLVAFEQLLARADTVSTVEKLGSTKVELWPMLWRGEQLTWPLGMGAGAFELGFSRWQTEQLGVTFTHPENVWFQSLADWGLPATVALVAVGLWLVRRTWKALGPLVLERTVLLAFAGVLLHEIFDFSLELQAVAAASAILMGLVLGVERGDEVRSRVHWWGTAIPLVGHALALAALLWGLPSHERAEAELSEAISSGKSVEEVKALAVQLIDRHPADWVLYANVASDFARRADPRESLAWVNRLLFLRPADARAHVAAGQALLRLGLPLQALGEFNTAWALGDDSSIDLALQVAVKRSAFDRLLIEKPQHLTRLWERLRRLEQPGAALALLESVEVSGMSDAVHTESKILRFRHELELGSAQKALELWNTLQPDARAQFPQQLQQLALLEKLGRYDEALQLAEKLVARSPHQLDLTLKLVDLYAARGRTARAREALERARPFFVDATQRSILFQREAVLLASEERWGRALDALDTSIRLEPQRPDLHYRRAELLERMGSLNAALDAMRAGRVLDTPAGAKAQEARVAKLEAALIGAGQ